jgi:hypothetical protein
MPKTIQIQLFESLNDSLSSDFFDQAYNWIESGTKSEKVAILMAQYGFFRNATACLSMLSIVVLLSYFISLLWQNHLILLVASLLFALLAYASFSLMKDRKKTMMSTTYQLFSTLIQP